MNFEWLISSCILILLIILLRGVFRKKIRARVRYALWLAVALRLVCEHLHIPVCDSVAFGDSMNDRELLQAAGLGICMENGSMGLKKLADDICPSVEQDGLCRAFLKHHLIQEQFKA